MRLFNSLQILTFVLSFMVVISATNSFANPHYDAQAPAGKGDVEDSPVAEEKLENTAITPAPDIEVKNYRARRFDRASYYYSYRRALSAHIGGAFVLQNPPEDDDEDEFLYLLGFAYMLPARLSPKWEIQMDLISAGYGHLSFLRKKIWNEKGAFRPYFRYGLTQKFVPDEKLASFSNWDNWLARGSFGIEDIERPPRSLRLGLDMAVGADDFQVLLTYGYSWGF